MAEFKLLTFGPPRLEREGRPIDLNLRTALALLVYLVVTAQRQSRDALATLLWPESNQRKARGRLRRTLHRLREDVGEDILDVSGETVGVHSHATLWLDCAAFDQHVATGSHAPASTAAVTPDQLEHLIRAATLYRDDFLAGWSLPDSPAFDEWQFYERERLRQTLAEVLARLAQVHETEGRFEAAIPYARRRLLLDPLDEAIHRQLMQLCAWAGQPAAALRQYTECARLLDAELGIAPDDATQVLFLAIKAKRPRRHRCPRPRHWTQVPHRFRSCSDHRARRARRPSLLREPCVRLACTAIGAGLSCVTVLQQRVSVVPNTSPTPVRRAACSTGSGGPRLRLARHPTGRDAHSPAASGPPHRVWTR